MASQLIGYERRYGFNSLCSKFWWHIIIVVKGGDIAHFFVIRIEHNIKKNKQKGGTDEICGLMEFTEI